ncbi:hypothetical protein K1T71_013128 [Dendrolimus kikuchii]|uniref:Uncharacterized protein n=1 Tax=Dendrolimus kikuchii TaxID=765133 RepID=A0ACC1CJ30_9NEOP|nr:hypothetical protein K1T71_013128 [Dendrolimus kikuchii]
MYFIVSILFTFIADATNVTKHKENITQEIEIVSKDNENPTVRDIGTKLVTFLNADINNTRIKELYAKLQEIQSYVVDKHKVEILLRDITNETKLTEINFYKSLSENDHFTFLTKNESQNLYLKLKTKMNRDDIMKILAERGSGDGVKISARKVMGDEDILIANGEVENVVDKLIGELPVDVHKFDAKKNESIYWDPQGELDDLKEHHQHDGRRIYKGERTSVRYYPFMVSIHVMGRFWCGGAIYWHDLVLTSAACLQLMHNNRFFRENPKVLGVRVGSNHSRIGGELIEALEVFFHPGYNPKTLNNNIAIVRLRRHLYFNYHRIPKVIGISHNDMGVPATAEVLLLGWGVTKMSQKLSYEPIFLQRKFLPVYPNSFCKEVYGDKFITSTMFCAGTFTTGEGACDHDAGGPAILAGKLVGIISFGPSVCGYPNAPTVFTLVGAFADWIETINETMPGYYRGKKRTTSTTRSYLYDIFDSWGPEGTKATKIRPINSLTTFTIPTTLTTSPKVTEETSPPALRGWDTDDNAEGLDLDSNK